MFRCVSSFRLGPSIAVHRKSLVAASVCTHDPAGDGGESNTSFGVQQAPLLRTSGPYISQSSRRWRGPYAQSIKPTLKLERSRVVQTRVACSMARCPPKGHEPWPAFANRTAARSRSLWTHMGIPTGSTVLPRLGCAFAVHSTHPLGRTHATLEGCMAVVDIRHALASAKGGQPARLRRGRR